MPVNPFLNKVTFLKGNGGLGGQGVGSDYISGLLYYDVNTGYTPSAAYNVFLSPADAIAAGYTPLTDETKAIYESAIGKGSTGDVISIYMLDPLGNEILLCTYTQTAGDSTDTLLAASLAAAINAALTGFTATNTGANLFVTMPAGYGMYPNANPGTNMTAVITGAITFGTPTNSTPGVASINSQIYYQVSEYFRLNPSGQLYFGYIKKASATITFTEIQTLQGNANGAIRQIGIYVPVPNSIASSASVVATEIVTYANTINAICATLEGLKTPLSALLGVNCYNLSTPSSLTNLNTLTDNFVTVIMLQDGNAQGNYLFQTSQVSSTSVGAALGAVSFSYVNECIAAPSKFNLSNGVELSVPAYANGVKYVINDTTSGLLDSYAYVYGGLYPDYQGTYFNNSYTACPQTNDYSFIELNRVIDKAIRLINAAFTPLIAIPLILNPDGTLQAKDVAKLQAAVIDALNPMLAPGAGRVPEASGVTVTIDPAQNILSTGTLTVGVAITPDAIARKFTVPIQYQA